MRIHRRSIVGGRRKIKHRFPPGAPETSIGAECVDRAEGPGIENTRLFGLRPSVLPDAGRREAEPTGAEFHYRKTER